MPARPSSWPLVVPAWRVSTRGLARLRLTGSHSVRDLGRIAVVGALRRHNGIARGALLQHAALQRAGLDAKLVDATDALRNPFATAAHDPATSYVFHIGVPETAQLVHGVLPAARRAWRIGYWAWELPTPPPAWRRLQALVGEVWAPSHFTATAFRSIFDVPVRVVPHRVMAAPARRRDPDKPFTVLTMADSRSSFTRKNPAGAVEAFRRAFGHRSDVRLVVKLNGRVSPQDEIVRLVRDTPGGEVLTSYLDDAGMRELFRSADVLLSLHRAEGFGLPMLEAMAHAVPVVGTAWSGNMDFMTAQNSALVPYDLTPVQDEAGIYHGSTWAEPDLDAAAEQLRALESDQTHYAELARAAHEHVLHGDRNIGAEIDAPAFTDASVRGTDARAGRENRPT